MDIIFEYIEGQQQLYVSRLTDWVAIQSVSADKSKRQDVQNMVEHVEKVIREELGGSTQLKDAGTETFPDGTTAPLPNILFAQFGNDKTKKTVLVYGHLDVQPAEKSDGWNTEPFVLTEEDGKLYGRGSTDDKGPVLCTLNAIEAYKKCNKDLPCNIKLVYEGMEESGSLGLDEVLKENKDFLQDVDNVMISDNYWLGTRKPCITYGTRGICTFEVEVKCAKKDLHSGEFGGTVYEAMSDLVALMNSLVDVKGNILIPHINDAVNPVTSEEEALYEAIDFDPEEYKAELEAYGLTYKTKKNLLMHRWRFPSLSLHGIEGAFSGEGMKTVIPSLVKGKFSIRLVPDMLPSDVNKLVEDHLKDVHATRGSPNPINVTMDAGAEAWLGDFTDEQYNAAVRATTNIYNVEPDMTRTGGSIPVILTFQEITQTSVMLLPVGSGDDGAHSQNEKINKYNFIEGTKLLASYFDEVTRTITEPKK